MMVVWTGHLCNGELQQFWWHSKSASFNSNSWKGAHDCGPRAFCDLYLFFYISSSLFHNRLFPIIFLFPILLDCTIIVLPLASFLLPQFCPSYLNASLISRFVAGDPSLQAQAPPFPIPVLLNGASQPPPSLPTDISGLRTSLWGRLSDIFISPPTCGIKLWTFLRFPISSVLSREKCSPGLDKRPILKHVSLQRLQWI